MRRILGFFLLAFSTFVGAEDFTIQTFAGAGLPQNIQGTSVVLQAADGIAADANGNAFFTVSSLNIVLKLDTNGVLTLVAGNGTPGFSGDGGTATSAQLYQPSGIALDAAGDVFIQDYGNARIRMVRNGIITTVAGGAAITRRTTSRRWTLSYRAPRSRRMRRGTCTSRIRAQVTAPLLPVAASARSRTA